jgi:hypothetical protein
MDSSITSVVIRNGVPWILIEVKASRETLSPYLFHFQKQTGAWGVNTERGDYEEQVSPEKITMAPIFCLQIRHPLQFRCLRNLAMIPNKMASGAGLFIGKRNRRTRIWASSLLKVSAALSGEGSNAK